MKLRIFGCLLFLGFTLHAEDIDTLAKRLSDTEISTRVDAAKSLGNLGDVASPAVPALIAAYKQAYKDAHIKMDSANLKKVITISLGQIGPTAKDAVPLLEYEIRHTGSPTALDAICKILPDSIAGANEMMAVHWCKRYVDAQAQYAFEKERKTKLSEYAQQLKGENGLEGKNYLIHSSFSNAEGDLSNAKPLYNYSFRVLKAQGDKVPGGKKSYVVDGKMTGGVALVAYPVEYGANGKKTFIVGLIDGFKKLYSKDLGPDSAKLGKEMAEFNPDDTWKEEDASWGLAPGSAPELKP